MFDVYQASSDNCQRYVIGKSGARPLHVIGLNPSTASQNKSDTTITKINNFSIQNKYDGFLVYNLYPIRATNPDNLPARYNAKVIHNNAKIIFDYISDSNQMDIWVAWGQMINKRSYLIKSLSEIMMLRKRSRMRILIDTLFYLHEFPNSEGNRKCFLPMQVTSH